MTALTPFCFSIACVAAGLIPSVFADELETAAPKATVALHTFFKDDFLIGSAVNSSITTGNGFRRSADVVQADIELVKKQFNHVVAENDMKWQMIHPRAGADGYDFKAADALVAFAAANNMSVAGHTLVWHSQTPNWVFEGTHLPPEVPDAAVKAPDAAVKAPDAAVKQIASQAAGNDPPTVPSNTETSAAGGPGRAPGPPGFGDGRGFAGQPGLDGTRRFGRFRPFDLNGPRASREELLERMRAHIHAVVGRYKGKIKVWDVVNEAIADNGDEVLRRSPWSVIVGPDFIAKAFEFAHEADPDAILRYNDYGLEKPEKRRKLIELIKSLQEQKIPVMAIGSQGHCNVTMTFETMDETLTELETLGLPIHITELDVNSAVGGQRGFGADISVNAQATEGGLVVDVDKQLADAYAAIFRAFLKHRDAIEIVTFWGPNDALSWRSRGRPLLFDGSNQPKPAFHAVIRMATTSKSLGQ